jgi:hypothetical protein
MARSLWRRIRYHIGTIGYFLILFGVFGAPVLGYWLIFHGDIIQTIHQLKMSLPGWGWTALKYGLSLAAAIAFMATLILSGLIVLWWGSRE